GLVGRDDRDPEHIVETSGEHCEPHQRSHQRREQTPALLHKLDDLAHGDGAHGASDVDKLHDAADLLDLLCLSSVRPRATGTQSFRAHRVALGPRLRGDEWKVFTYSTCTASPARRRRASRAYWCDAGTLRSARWRPRRWAWP